LLRLLQILRLARGEVGAVSAKGIELRPEKIDAVLVERASRRIREFLAGHPGDAPIDVVAEIGDDEALVVPKEIAVMLAQVLSLLEQGTGVQIMPLNAMLTTQQAADTLNVSRPYLVGLLEAGKIPFTMVGTHRRVAFGDLLDYQREDHQSRRAVVDDLTRMAGDLGED
jgi:excisionase family DNA binding protein